MSLVRMKLKELQDGQVKFISLVDRAATRMPIRILKREIDMIDLTSFSRAFKKDQPVIAVAGPTVSAIIVYAQKNEDIAAKVQKAVSDQGYKVDTILKNEDGKTIMFAQVEDPLKDAQLVRLSDTMVVALKGFQPANPNIDGTNFEAAASSKNFHQGVDSALDVLFEKVCNTLNAAKSEQDAATQVGTLLEGFTKYMVGMVKSLPPTAFKCDIAVRAVTADPKAYKGDIYSLSDIDALLSTKCPTSMGENEWGNMDTNDKLNWILASYVSKGDKPGDPAKPVVVKGDMSCPDGMDKDKWGAMSDDDKKKHMAMKDAETKKAAKREAAQKRQNELLAAIQAVSTKVDTLRTDTDAKLAAITTKTDEAVTKSEDLAKKVTGMVAAGPGPTDTPGKGPITVKKEDPRSGNFDTAYLRRQEQRRTAN